MYLLRLSYSYSYSYSYPSFILQICNCANLFIASLIYFILCSILSMIHNSPRNSFIIYLIKVSTPSNMSLSKARIVLFVITLKLGADNHFHHFLTHPVNFPIIILVLVLLSQFLPCVMKYNVIVYDHLFNSGLISFW